MNCNFQNAILTKNSGKIPAGRYITFWQLRQRPLTCYTRLNRCLIWMVIHKYTSYLRKTQQRTNLILIDDPYRIVILKYNNFLIVWVKYYVVHCKWSGQPLNWMATLKPSGEGCVFTST
jgi:hypothetical protein